MSANRQYDVGADTHDESSFIIAMQASGELDERAARALCTEFRRRSAATGSAFLFADFSGVTSMGAAARKAVLEELRDVRLDAVAVLGASFQIRVLSMLIARVLQMFTRHYPLRFFDTEEEARAWLLEQRRTRGG